MKSIKNYLNSCLESLLDDDDIYLDPKNDKKVVEEWIKNNYIIAGKLTISDDFVVDCSGDVYVKNRNIESLTNGLFSWGDVRGDFDCTGCNNLKSLEGAPENVGGDFYCKKCEKLTSLEGGPEIVGRNFSCSNCENLKTLKGAPKKIGRGFWCSDCLNLKITDSDRKKYKFMR